MTGSSSATSWNTSPSGRDRSSAERVVAAPGPHERGELGDRAARVEAVDVRSRDRLAQPAPPSGDRRRDVVGAARAARNAASRADVVLSTRSPSTAPASTDASWSGSPTSTSRVAGRERLEQPGHQRQRHHRALVDDHDVEGQVVVAVVPEPARRRPAASRAAGAASTPTARRARRGRSR